MFSYIYLSIISLHVLFSLSYSVRLLLSQVCFNICLLFCICLGVYLSCAQPTLCLCMSTYRYIHLLPSMYVHMYVCIDVWMYRCMYVCIDVCVLLCTFLTFRICFFVVLLYLMHSSLCWQNLFCNLNAFVRKHFLSTLKLLWTFGSATELMQQLRQLFWSHCHCA